MPVDPSASVASTARIHSDAVIGPRCSIGEFCVIEADAVLGRDCRLEPYVLIRRWTTLGKENEISAGTVLGTDPLDKAFTGERSYLQIGDRNRIREHYTISRGTKPESITLIGDDNYIMTSGHIAHNATVGNGVVIASCALVAGYVTVGDGAFLSGGVVVHQHSAVGTLAMIGGNTRVNADAPPYFLYSGFDIKPVGVNVVGLRRAGLPAAAIVDLKRAYRILYRSGLKRDEAATAIETQCTTEFSRDVAVFVRGSKRGICRP